MEGLVGKYWQGEKSVKCDEHLRYSKGEQSAVAKLGMEI